MLAEVAQGCGLPHLPVTPCQVPVPSDHVQQAALASTIGANNAYALPRCKLIPEVAHDGALACFACCVLHD